MNTVIEFTFQIFVLLNGETLAGNQNIKGSVVHINYNKFKFLNFYCCRTRKFLKIVIRL